MTDKCTDTGDSQMPTFVKVISTAVDVEPEDMIVKVGSTSFTSFY